MAENKNIKNEGFGQIEGLILRSPLLRAERKSELLDGLRAKSAEELLKMESILVQSEKNLFKNLEKAGVDITLYQEKMKKFFNVKTKKLEEISSADEISNIEKELENL